MHSKVHANKLKLELHTLSDQLGSEYSAIRLGKNGADFHNLSSVLRNPDSSLSTLTLSRGDLAFERFKGSCRYGDLFNANDFQLLEIDLLLL